MIVFSGASAVISYEGSVRQRNTLSEIRTTIEQEIAYSHIHKSLMETFSTYHGSNGEDLGRLFSNRYD
ncbi:MAG: hypothetical protein U5J63_05810 [Fodinibius sp.]|nr:hypothetical protein [Fodinibius sp.]